MLNYILCVILFLGILHVDVKKLTVRVSVSTYVLA